MVAAMQLVTMSNAPFRKRLRATREKQGLSGRKLARIAGLSESAVGMIENGEHGVTLATAVALAKALDVSLDWLAMGRTP